VILALGYANQQGVFIQEKEMIYREGTVAYQMQKKSFLLGDEEAFVKLGEFHKTRKLHPGFFHFIIGDYYFYDPSGPHKIEVPFSGYYIHGNSGKVEYREAQKIRKGKYVPRSFYKKVEILSD